MTNTKKYKRKLYKLHGGSAMKPQNALSKNFNKLWASVSLF